MSWPSQTMLFLVGVYTIIIKVMFTSIESKTQTILTSLLLTTGERHRFIAYRVLTKDVRELSQIFSQKSPGLTYIPSDRPEQDKTDNQWATHSGLVPLSISHQVCNLLVLSGKDQIISRCIVARPRPKTTTPPRTPTSTNPDELSSRRSPRFAQMSPYFL